MAAKLTRLAKPVLMAFFASFVVFEIIVMSRRPFLLRRLLESAELRSSRS